MLRDFDRFYLQKEEPVKSCLIALREIILKQDREITVPWKYGMPFSVIKEKCFVISGCTRLFKSHILVLWKGTILKQSPDLYRKRIVLTKN